MDRYGGSMGWRYSSAYNSPESRKKWAIIRAIQRRKALSEEYEDEEETMNYGGLRFDKNRTSTVRSKRFRDRDFEDDDEEEEEEKEFFAKRKKASSRSYTRPAEDETKLGSLTYDTVLQSTYDFYTMTPFNYEQDTSLDPVFSNGRKKIPSLKEMCVMKIVKDCHTLTYTHLGILPWKNNWERIWNYILYYHLDSFKVFKLFYDKFSKEKNFKCHLIDGGGSTEMFVGNKKREHYIFQKTTSSNHRIETFAKNISFQTLMNGLNNFSRLHSHTLTFLNLSGLKKGDLENNFKFQYLPNLSSLNALDVSYTLVDDQMIKLWSISINAGKWDQLEMIILHNTKVENITDLLSLKRGNLRYIEADRRLKSIHNSWDIKQYMVQLENKTLVEKYEILGKSLRLIQPIAGSTSLQPAMYLDVQIVDDIFEMQYSNHEYEHLNKYQKLGFMVTENNKLRDIWSLRDKTRSKNYYDRKYYMRWESHIVPTATTTTSVKMENPKTLDSKTGISTPAASVKSVKKMAKPRNRISAKNAQAFFGL